MFTKISNARRSPNIAGAKKWHARVIQPCSHIHVHCMSMAGKSLPISGICIIWSTSMCDIWR